MCVNPLFRSADKAEKKIVSKLVARIINEY